MTEPSPIQRQIEEDDGVPGARARKNAQRAKDANPVKGSKPFAELEADQTVALAQVAQEQAEYEASLSLFSRLLKSSE